MAVLMRHKSTIYGLTTDLATLSANISTEFTRASEAEATLAADLAAEITRATSTEGTLANLTTTVKTDLVSAINSLNTDNSSVLNALNAEITRAQNAEATLQSNIDAEEAARIAADDAEFTRATDAEATLASDLAAEVVRATDAEATLASDLAAEVVRATDAEATLTSDLAAEVVRATDAEATIVANLNAEITRAVNADSTLTSDLAAEVVRATDAEATLTSDLAAEVVRATDAEATLQANIDVVDAATLKIANNLSDVADVETARTNLEVYSKLEVAAAITEAGLNLGTNFSTADAAAAATDFDAGSLSVGDNIFVVDDGDTKWAIYKVIAITDGAYSTSTLEKIMDEDVYLNAQSAATIKATYESNADTNGFTDNNVAQVDRIDVDGDGSLVLTTEAQTVLEAINELDSAINSQSTDIQAELDAEITRAKAAESTLQSNIDAEEAARIAADDAEFTRATDAEATLTSDLAAEVVRATDAEATLASDLAAEVVRATDAEATLTSDLAAEVVRATDAEATIVSNLNAEITRATQAEATLTSDLNAEITRAITAEESLSAEIGDMGAVAGTLAGTDLVSLINELESDKMEKSANLSDLTDVSVARTNLGVYSTSEVDEAIRLGGAIFITETLTVSGDSITLTNSPKNDVIFNFATVRHLDTSNYVSYDVPVTGTGTSWTLSPDTTGQFDGKTVTVQYAYIPVA